MKQKPLFVLSLCLISFSLNAQVVSWLKSIGSPLTDRIGTVIAEPTGNSYLTMGFGDTGYFNGTQIFPGMTFLTKFDATGNVLWIKTDIPYFTAGILASNGHLLYFGQTVQDLIFGNDTVNGSYMLEADSSGNWLSAEKITECLYPSRFTGAHFDDYGQLYVFGVSSNHALAAHGDSRKESQYSWVTRRNSNGTWQNLYCYGFPESLSWINNAHIDPAGNIYTIGYEVIGSTNFSKIDPFGNTLIHKDYGGSFDFDAFGNYAIFGKFMGSLNINGTVIQSIDSTIPDLYLAQFDPNDSLISLKNIGGQGMGAHITLLPYGLLLATGNFDAPSTIGCSPLVDSINLVSGARDVFVALLDPLGNAIWATAGGSPNNDFIGAIPTQQNILVFGNSNYTGSAGPPVTFSMGSQSITGSGGPDVFIGAIDYGTTGMTTLTSHANKLSIYPNPARNNIEVAYDYPAGTDLKLSLFDLQGRVLKTIPLKHIQGPGKKLINLESYESGLYFLKLESGKEIITRKFIKL